jgi:hypothetical protein
MVESSITVQMKNKLIAIQCLSLCDIGTAVYSYFSLSNFEEFKKIINQFPEFDSPEFQVEIYKLFLQTVTFVSLLVICLHLIIYFFYYRDKKFARGYVKMYSAVAATSLLFCSLYFNQFSLMIPTVLYAVSFYYITKSNTTTSKAA